MYNSFFTCFVLLPSSFNLVKRNVDRSQSRIQSLHWGWIPKKGQVVVEERAKAVALLLPEKFQDRASGFARFVDSGIFEGTWFRLERTACGHWPRSLDLWRGKKQSVRATYKTLQVHLAEARRPGVLFFDVDDFLIARSVIFYNDIYQNVQS